MSVLSDVLDVLTAKGVASATFHADGRLASVEFRPDAASPDDANQNEAPKQVSPRRSAVAGLVPRIGIDS